MNEAEFQKLLETERLFQRDFSAWNEEFQKRNTDYVYRILRVDFSSTRIRVIFPADGMIWMPFVLEACEKFFFKIEETCVYKEKEELWLSFKR